MSNKKRLVLEYKCKITGVFAHTSIYSKDFVSCTWDGLILKGLCQEKEFKFFDKNE